MQVLIVYHSRLGSVKSMARLIARGVESVPNCEAILRCVPEVSSDPIDTDTPDQSIPDSGDPYSNLDELKNCNGLIIGSPTRFGNMSSALKHFLDQTSSLWMSGDLIGKPAAVFTSSSSMHGGQESTLLSMLNPLIHQGMLICGIPYTETALNKTITGGTPYGASHVAGPNNSNPISDDEKSLCMALGKRVAIIATALNNNQAK